MDRTFSLLVPYFSVLMPLPPVLAIPPMEGFDDGSGPKSKPSGSRNLFSSFFSTPAPTTASCSPSTAEMRFIRHVSITTPPRYATHPPSSPVPAPLGTIGTLRT
jgi:hypothetical protein